MTENHSDQHHPWSYIHVSNTLTYASLLAGLLAALAAAEFSSWNVSGGLIAFCALADTFDGRFARMFSRTADQSRFGVEIDSLTDAVVFGILPLACMVPLLDFDASPAWRVPWLIAAMLYLISALTRLGCYNLHQSAADQFTGLPTTLSGLILSAAFLARPSPLVSACVLIACAVAMLAPVQIPRPRKAGLAAFVATILMILALHSVEVFR